MKIELSKKELYNIIKDYYENRSNYNIDVYEKYKIINNEEIKAVDLSIFYMQKLDVNCGTIRLENKLSESELLEILNDFYNNKVLSYELIGGINEHLRYDEAFFNGISIYLKEKEKILVRG